MPVWEFLDYVAESGIAPIDEWIVNYLSSGDVAEFDLAVDYLQRIHDWDSVKKASRKYRELKRYLAGLTEIKFSRTTQALGKNKKVQFRPLGILLREKRQFIFVGGFQKGNPPIPEDAYKLALRYKGEYENGRGSFRAHKT